MSSDNLIQIQVTYNGDHRIPIFNETIQHMYEAQELWDVKISAQRNQIKAHKIILAAFSPYLRNIFNAQKEKFEKQAELTLNNVNGEALKVLVDYCYTRVIKITSRTVDTLLSAASVLMLEDVKKLCETFVAAQQSFQLQVPENRFPSFQHSGASGSQPGWAQFIVTSPREVTPTDKFMSFQLSPNPQSVSQSPFRDAPLHGHGTSFTFNTDREARDKPSKKLDAYVRQSLQNFLSTVDRSKLPSVSEFQEVKDEPLDETDRTVTEEEESAELIELTEDDMNEEARQDQDNLPAEMSDCVAPLNLSVLSSACGITSDSSNFECKLCSQTFQEVNAFQEHMKTHMEQMYPGILTSPVSGDSMAISPGSSAELPCDGKGDNLLLKGEKDKNTVCSLCGSRFKDIAALRCHRRIHVKRFVCHFCGKRFSHSGNLHRHWRIHTGEKPYQCPHCSKCMAGSTELQNHIKKHMGNLPFMCGVCGLRFVSQYHLRHHTRNQHPEMPNASQGRGSALLTTALPDPMTSDAVTSPTFSDTPQTPLYESAETSDR